MTHLLNMKIDIDDDLIKSALEISQTTLNAQDFVHKLILAYTRTEAGRGLAALGGKAPNMKEIPR
jgi:Arc/MetJ family transcription regulator